MLPRSADFEVGDTAGLETCATSYAKISERIPTAVPSPLNGERVRVRGENNEALP
jgi:hypothetical protein